MDIDAYLKEDGLFTGSVLVRRSGATVLDKGYGEANRETGSPNSPQTCFQLCSVSKQFAAVAILLLQERGALAVQDRIDAWIPHCPDAWRPITVHHLLTHTSGIGHWQDYPDIDLWQPNTSANLVRIFQREPLKFSPGASWSYSSPAYVLLAQIVEHVAKAPYADFLTDALLRPLGMDSTGAGRESPKLERHALGYSKVGPAPSFDLDTVAMGAGDLWSTTADLQRWNAFLAAPGLLDAETLAAMLTPHARLPQRISGLDEPAYGYGVFLGKLRGRTIIFHPGDNSGFVSMNAWIPEDDVMVILLGNNEYTDVQRRGIAIAGSLLE